MESRILWWKRVEKEVHDIHNNENRQFTSRHRRECLCIFFIFSLAFSTWNVKYSVHNFNRHTLSHTHCADAVFVSVYSFSCSFICCTEFIIIVLAVHLYGEHPCASRSDDFVCLFFFFFFFKKSKWFALRAAFYSHVNFLLLYFWILFRKNTE